MVSAWVKVRQDASTRVEAEIDDRKGFYGFKG
jgi:hypothetical protein